MIRNKPLGLFLTGLILGLLIGFVNRVWPAENTVQAEEDYVAIMEQAENWPMVKEDITMDNMIYRLHVDPSNNNNFTSTVCFLSKKENSYRCELFAKVIYCNSKYIAALKAEDDKWTLGDYIVNNYVKFNGYDGIAFRLFSNKNRHDPIIIRIFLLKDLVPLKK